MNNLPLSAPQPPLTFDQLPTAVQNLAHEVTALKDYIAAMFSGVAADKPEPKLITRQQAADKLQVSLNTLTTYTREGKVKGYRIGTRVLYKEAEVLQALKEIKPLPTA